VQGQRARALRAQLASWHPEGSAEEIEDAIQTACERFLEHAEGIKAPGEVYVWIRTTAHRVLNRETVRYVHELRIDPSENGLEDIPAEEPGPAEELISNEDDADLTKLVEEVCASVSDRGRAVLALHGTGCKRPEIADRLGLSERIVKRELEEIMQKARAVISRLSGGGCAVGEVGVLRFVCGLATASEEAQARDHLARCGRCEIFCERLIAWREKVGATLPAPVAEGATPGLLERVAQKTSDGIASVKQQILDGGAQLKQQAMATYYRAVDPTPLAAARPGTFATVVASCIAIGGGTATYCVEKGVNPIGAAKGLIAEAPEKEPAPPSPPPESTQPAPVYIPAETPPPSEEPSPVPVEETTQPEAEKQEKAESSSQPPPEDSYEPVRPEYMASESEGTESSEGTEEPSSVESSREPDAVPSGAGPQLGGP
jgi:RNA polymerase sigma factor (sigma-70 family)